MKVFLLSLAICIANTQVNPVTTSDEDAKWIFDISSKDLARQHWEKYKLTFDKHYESETEEYFRMLIFLDSVADVTEHNKEYSKGLVPFEKAINNFSDMTRIEFREKVLGCAKESDEVDEEDDSPEFVLPPGAVIPDEKDWRKLGVDTPVRSQGDCKSCYAFAAAAALEGQNILRNDNNVTLSVQQLIDCAKNDGCGGGSTAKCFRYLKQHDGIDTDESYPYEEKKARCRYNPAYKAASESRYVVVKPKKNEDKLKEVVASIGPVAVSIQSRDSLKYWKGGVYYDPQCKSSIQDVNHAVLIVGYGRDDTDPHPDYWLIKNSWGPNWGENGYFRLARNEHNHCGVATIPRYPLV